MFLNGEGRLGIFLYVIRISTPKQIFDFVVEFRSEMCSFEILILLTDEEFLVHYN